jgi:hypothetical protein
MIGVADDPCSSTDSAIVTSTASVTNSAGGPLASWPIAYAR